MAPLQADRQTSFARGMRDSASPTEYAENELAVCLNGRPSRVGNTIQRRDGSKRLHATGLNGGAAGLGATDYYTAARQRRYVVVCGDKWYVSADDGATWTQIGAATGFNLTQWSLRLMRVGAENRVLGANGGPNVMSWNGAGDIVQLTNWPAGIKHLAVFNDRLYGSDGSINVRGSKVGDPATLATAEGGLFVKCQAHDDDPELFGLWTHGVYLLVFKKKSMGYIDGYGYNSLTVQTGERGLTRSVGCIAHRSIAPAGDGGVCWLSQRGLEYMAPGGLSPTLVSAPIQGFMNKINQRAIANNPGLPVATWWERLEEYWLAVPTGTATQNTSIIVFRPPAPGRPPAIWLFRQEDPTGHTLYIDGDGILQVQEDSTRFRVRLVDGVLELDPTIGQFVNIDANGILQIAGLDSGVSAFFVADQGTKTERPHMVGYDGIVRELEIGAKDDVLSDGTSGKDVRACARSRPFIFRDPLRTKKPRSVRLSIISEDAASEATVRVYGDGAELQSRDIDIRRGSATRPKPERLRVGGQRASAIQVEVEFNDPITLQAIEVAAEMLDEVP